MVSFTWNQFHVKIIVTEKFLISYSVEISWFLYHPEFMWNQFWGLLKCKISHFTTFRGSEFWFLWIFALSEDWNLPNEQYSQPLKWQKRYFLHCKNPQNWFHVKSEWYKNLEISTLWSREVGQKLFELNHQKESSKIYGMDFFWQILSDR